MSRALLSLGLAAALLPRAARAECAAPVTSSELRLVMEEAEAAYGALDGVGVAARVAEAEAMVPCLAEELTRPDVARYHRMQGLYAFLQRHPEEAQRAFLAARTVEPSYRLPTSLVPEGHPLRDVYAALPVDAVRRDYAPAPADGYLLFDGVQTLQRPLDHPTLLQRVDDYGAVRASLYLQPSDPLPRYMTAPLGGRRWVRVPLAMTAATAAVAAGGFYAASWDARREYYGDAITVGQLAGAREEANRNYALSVGAGAIALTAGVALAWVW